MRSAFLVVLAVVFSCTTAFAQVEPGNVRVGVNLTKVLDQAFNLSGIEGQVGYVANQNFEVGALVGYVRNDLDISMVPDVGGSFKAGGYLMVNLTPGSRHNFGLFLGASKQFGDFDPFVIDIGGKNDIALGEKTLLHISAGLERIGEADVVDTPTEWVTTKRKTLLYVRVGIAGLTRR